MKNTEIIVPEIDPVSRKIKKVSGKVIETRLAEVPQEGGMRLLSVTQMIGIEKNNITRHEETMRKRKQEVDDLVKERKLMIREGKERIKLLERVKATLEKKGS